jgi:hypothetical protein
VMAARSITRGASVQGPLPWGAARSPGYACGVVGRCAGGWSLNPGASERLEMNVGGWLLAQPRRVQIQCYDSNILVERMADRSILSGAAMKGHHTCGGCSLTLE